MNIFYLHKDPKTCAEMHIDKHCVKMIIEYAQLMSTAHRMLDGLEYEGRTKTGRRVKRWLCEDIAKEQIVDKASHIHHPSAVWVRESAYQYWWLYQMWSHLCDEFTYRYGKQHLTDYKLRKVLREIPKNAPLNKKFTEPPQAMPDEVKVVGDSITAYRQYYMKHKRGFATWKKDRKPAWFQKKRPTKIY